MKIVSSQEFNHVINTFSELMKQENVSIKSSRIRELLAESQGDKTSNGLLSRLPLTFKTDKNVVDIISCNLKEKFQYENVNVSEMLDKLIEATKPHVIPRYLGDTGIKLDYSELSPNDSQPLLYDGIGSLKEAVAFLVFIPEHDVIYPAVIKRSDDFDSPSFTHGIIQRVQLPNTISLSQIHTFLSKPEVINQFNIIKAGLTIEAEPNKLRYGFLNEKGQKAKNELKRLVVQDFGAYKEPVLEINC